MTLPISPKHNQDQEEILEALNAASWDEIEAEYSESSLQDIKASLDKMFWSDADANHVLAQQIYDELN